MKKYLLIALSLSLFACEKIIEKPSDANGTPQEVYDEMWDIINEKYSYLDVKQINWEAVKNKYPQIKIIMLTVFDNDENIFKSIKAGADGYLLKEVNPEELHNAIVETLNGGAIMTPSIALKTLKLFRNPEAFEDISNKEEYNLTAREIEVLEQLSKGLKYNAIAENLFLSTGTIRKHVENIYTKLQVHNKMEAIQKAKSNKLI